MPTIRVTSRLAADVLTRNSHNARGTPGRGWVELLPGNHAEEGLVGACPGGVAPADPRRTLRSRVPSLPLPPGAMVRCEQFLVIYDELIANFILALVAVAVLSLFVLGQLSIVVLVCMTVVSAPSGCS